MLAEQAVATARLSRVLSSDPVRLADEPVHSRASWISAYQINPFDVAAEERTGRLLELSERLLGADGVDHVNANLIEVLENKYYADSAGTRTLQQRVRVHPEFTAVRVDMASGGFSSMRTLAPPAGRGWEYLTGTGWDFDAEIAELPQLLAEHAKAPSVEAGRYDLVIDPTNLWLTIHESIGHATELDRALGYEAAYAGTSFATPDRLGTLRYGSELMNVTGDRTEPHGLASIGYDDEGVATTEFDLICEGVLVGYQLNRQMALANGFGPSNGCAFADSPGHIPLQRMANVSLQPDPDGGSTAGSDRRRGARYLRGRRQLLVDRHAALQLPVHRPAVLQDHQRPAGRPAARPGLPGEHHRLLGIDGRGRRAAELPAGRCLQLWQGPAGPDRGGVARLPGGTVSRRERAEHGQRGRSVMAAGTGIGGHRIQDWISQALALSEADGCVVVGEERTEANLRWAANSLTTNGQMHSRKLTVISIVDGPDGASSGVVSGPVTAADPAGALASLVAASEAAARAAAPADDAAPLVPAGVPDPGWDEPPTRTGIEVFTDFAPALGAAFGSAAAAGQLLYGFAEHVLTCSYLASSTGLRRRFDQPTGRLELNGKTADLGSSAWVGSQTRDFRDVDVPALTADLDRRLGWSQTKIELPPGRYETLLPPSAVADLLLFARSEASARDAEEGRSVYSAAGGGTRLGESLAALPLTLRSDPAEPGMQCAPFVIASPGGPQSVFDSGAEIPAVDWITGGRLTNLHRNRNWAARTGTAFVPMPDNLILTVDSTDGVDSRPSLEQMIASTERGLLLTCLWYVREVDPQTLLVTGLTRDGVYLIERGQVCGVVNNFRFNDSPVDLLGRITEVGATRPTLPREFSDDFTRAAMPPIRVSDFNMSTVSQAS